MDSLEQIESGLQTPWTDNALFHLIETLVICISHPDTPKRVLSAVWRISEKIRKTTSIDSKVKLIEAFDSAKGNFHLQLRFYRRLELPSCLKTLARLAQGLQDFQWEIRDFQVDFNPEVLNSDYLPGAVWISKASPSAELLEWFASRYLIEKVSIEHKNLIRLFGPMIGKLSVERFTESFLGPIKRLCIRSTGTLPVMNEIYQMLQCDLSEVVEEIVFPTLVEYLYQADTCVDALAIVKTVLGKAKCLKLFVKQLVATRNVNESQTLALLKMIKVIPPSDYSSKIIEFVIQISQRIKSDLQKAEIAESFAHLLTKENLPIDFLLSQATHPSFANLISKFQVNANLNYNQNTPFGIISVLAVKFPEQAPGKITNFVTDAGSVLFSLQNLGEEETLALTKAVINALAFHPNNVNLLKRLSKSLVSPFCKVKKYCLDHFPQVSIASILTNIKENLTEDTSLTSISQVFPKLSYIVSERFEKPEDIHSYISLLTTPGLCTNKKIKFVLKKFSQKLALYNDLIFATTPENTGLVLSLENFSEKVGILLSEINFEDIIKTQHTLDYVQKVFEDPNFDDFVEFNQMCRGLYKAAGVVSEVFDSPTVVKALLTIWEKSIFRCSFVLKSFMQALDFRVLVKKVPEFFDFLSNKVLKDVLKLTGIVELQGVCWDFIYKLISFSPNFARISWDFTTALYKSSRNQWSDKALSHLFKFTDGLSIGQIAGSEAYILERVVLWVLKQSGTSLRSTALNILIDFLHSGKFNSLEETIEEICLLIESYSSPLLNSLFQPLLDILEPHHWESFMNILLKLQPTTKQIVLDSLLQYNKALQCTSWIVTPVYLCLFDETDVVSSSASEVWEKNSLILTQNVLLENVLQNLFDPNLELSLMTSLALKDAIVKNPEWSGEVIKKVQREVTQKQHKNGFVNFFKIICPIVSKHLVLEMEEFLLDIGMLFADVSNDLLQVAILYLNTHGELLMNEFFTMLQLRTTHLNEKIRNSAVVLIGYLARFFNSEDFRIESTIDLLLKALDLPSELLFSTVSKFLPRLVSFRHQLVEPLLLQEFKKLIEVKPIPLRRGAGYGIGCLVKGCGLKSLVTYNILDKLEAIINNKKAGDIERGGVLIAIEGLGAVLGRGFEPYLGEVLPFIIDCFANRELQEQAAVSTKVMISKLSAHGMKRILPQLTHGLEETKWRSKVGAIEALGKMAFCAPKQLSAALPNIVPQVIKAFSDTNPKVLEAANKAISDIGSVITNPEIFQLVPFLSKALGDISNLSEAFKVLIDTTFHHFLDTPSLSIIVPLLETGLRSRNSEYKKQACQIVGGITSLIRNPSEFSPYLERITSAMKFSLFDSLPEVRNIAAQNLASFCQGIGEEFSKSIIDWLLETMEKSLMNFERSGAVHAYSEYLLYDDRWMLVLDHLLDMVKDPSTIVRESYLGLFIFIPLNTQGKFEKYISKVLPTLLDRLSDESEDVRRIVIRVMQLLIQTYCKSNLENILPPLELGLFDRNWRKRASCITLIGEMVEKIESLSRKENQQLISQDHKNRILASIYILRADHSSNINTQAAQIWKTHVDNTPKFLVALTPELVLRLIEISDNNEPEPREIAAFAIQNLIQKYQNKIFSSYLKHFLTHFERCPKGVAFALRTVCETASRNLLITYSEPIIQILEVLLKSDDVDFLHNAGGIFHDMYQKTTIDRPDPAVLALLDKMVKYPKACKELLNFKNIGITKALLPKVMQADERIFVLPVIGKIIADDLFAIKGLETLFTLMLQECETQKDMLIPVQIILANISDPSYLNTALNASKEILSNINQLQVLNYFCKNSTIFYQSFIDKMLAMALQNLHSNEEIVLNLLAETVKLILAPLEKDQLPDFFPIFKNQLNSLTAVPLFNIPKGLDPFLQLAQNSLMYGNIEIKELAARSYCEIIGFTEAESLNSYAVMIVGPLIRVVSEKVPGDVKVSMLDALYLLLQKSPLKLKPFISQLQSTFTKAVTHPEANVRESGARNIIELLKMKPRLDILFGDLGTLNGPSEVVVKALDTLQRITKAIEVPSQLLSSTCNKIVTEISESVSREVAEEAGKFIYAINMDLSVVLQSLYPISSAIALVSSILIRSRPESIQTASGFIDNSFKANYEETLKLFENIAKTHPMATFDLVQKYFPDIAWNILPALSMISALPAEKFNKIETLTEIFPALAKECLTDQTEEVEETLKDTIKKVFNMKDKGVKNILKSLHLLDQDTQTRFRNFAVKLSS